MISKMAQQVTAFQKEGDLVDLERLIFSKAIESLSSSSINHRTITSIQMLRDNRHSQSSHSSHYRQLSGSYPLKIHGFDIR